MYICTVSFGGHYPLETQLPHLKIYLVAVMHMYVHTLAEYKAWRLST